MKKLLLVLLAALLVIAAVSYIGLQWQVRTSVDKLFRSLSLLDGRYETVSVDLRGQISITRIAMDLPGGAGSVSIGQVGLATSGLLETLMLHRNLKAGRLPKAITLKLDGFAIRLPAPTLGRAGMGQSDWLRELTTLGCGRFVSLGAQQYSELGLHNLTFDLLAAYTFDPSNDELISTLDLYMDGMGQIILDQTTIGLEPLMQNVNIARAGFDPSTVSTASLRLVYSDLGYNQKIGDYCARASGLTRPEWDDLHAWMVQSVFNQIELSGDFDIMSLYQGLRADRARLEVNLRPLPGFSLGDLQYYTIADLIELIDLSIVLNDSPVAITELDWNQDRLATLNLSAVRKAFRVGPDESTQGAVETNASTRRDRILTEIALTDLGSYRMRTVQLEREDGQRFTGQLMEVTAERVVIRTRFNSGFTDLPIARAVIRAVKIYPD
jgi:hypothetical protein